MAKVCFRFDVDTHKCAKTGIPNLLKLAREKDVKFTFFVNCGQAISRLHSVRAKLENSAQGDVYPSLSARRKLGNWEFLVCFFLNPYLVRYSKNIRRAFDEGHEIGLHGGRNHELWCRLVDQWPDHKIKDEIRWGLDQLQAMGIVPDIFASPCAKGGARVNAAVASFSSFKYISDTLDPNVACPKVLSPLMDIPTSICGEGGVAYIEQQVALGRTEQQIVQHFNEAVSGFKACALYDHPYFAGVEALPILSKLIDAAKNCSASICSIKDLGQFFTTVGQT